MSNIVLLHGWGFPAAVFTPLIETLEEDFDVSAPDMPGYADNSASDNNPDVLKHLEYPALLVGWSLGAIHAMQLALRQPHQVTALVLLAATPCFVNRMNWSAGMDKGVFDDFNRQVNEDSASAMQLFVRLNSGKRADSQSAVALTDLSNHVTHDALQQGMSELAELDLRSCIAEIDIPVLLLHAADDRVVPATASHWLDEQLPDSNRVEFQTGGHAFFLQQTDSVAGHIRAMA